MYKISFLRNCTLTGEQHVDRLWPVSGRCCYKEGGYINAMNFNRILLVLLATVWGIFITSCERNDLFQIAREMGVESGAVYTVTYHANSASGGNVPVDTTNYTEGKSVTVFGNTGSLVKTGYTFAGWNTAADGSGSTYSEGETFAMGTADVMLYAQWVVPGTLDTSFDPDTGADNTVYSIAVQSDGKILIGGSFTSYNGTTRNRIARIWY